MTIKRLNPLKRMYRYMLRTFLPLLAMTFGISWFIVLMQFLWKYVDDMVGKGLSVDVLAQMIFYAAMTLVPMALPLGILLASLMTFGNMGERLELLAMKSAGVPLYRIMKPLLAVVSACAIGLFFFLNDTMIRSQVKLYTIIYSARHAAPELDIPEGAFYNEVKGYNIYVTKKGKDSHMLYGVMIYDHSSGFERARIIRSDSAKLTMDESRTFLTLRLYHGESFETLRPESYQDDAPPIPYANEQFGEKEIIIPFDARFTMMDESNMSSLYIGKNLVQLDRIADTAQHKIDSARTIDKKFFAGRIASSRYLAVEEQSPAEAGKYAEKMAAISPVQALSLDSLWKKAGAGERVAALEAAAGRVDMLKNDLAIRQSSMGEYYYTYRSHALEWHRKFTFPVACIVFFFIGAPLGAIIRKGGLGTPIVASVLLFVFYYMIDTFGSKMAKGGDWPVWEGMWLSTAVLLPLGMFLTYKASRDSASLNLDTYANFIKKVFNPKRVRRVEIKEVIIRPITQAEALDRISVIRRFLEEIYHLPLFTNAFFLVWTRGADNRRLSEFKQQTDELVDFLRDFPDRLVLSKLMDIPLLPQGLSHWLPAGRFAGYMMIVLFPVSMPLNVYLAIRRKHVWRDLELIDQRLAELSDLISNPRDNNN